MREQSLTCLQDAVLEEVKHENTERTEKELAGALSHAQVEKKKRKLNRMLVRFF